MPAQDRIDRDEFAALAEEAAEFEISLSALPPVERVEIPTSDGPLSALRFGEGDPEVVFLHGVGLNAHTFDSTVLALGRPALALDLPGHGRSAWRDDGRYGASVLAPAVVEAVRALAPGAAAVVGQSLGGLTAIALSARAPELVRRLVLVDALPTASARTSASQVVNFLDGPRSFASREEIVERAHAFGFGHSKAALRRGVAHNTVLADDGSYVWRHHVGQRPEEVTWHDSSAELWPALASYRGPVTLVRATDGYLDEDQLEELARRAPQAVRIEVATGHNVQEQDPVRLAAIVEAAVEAPPS